MKVREEMETIKAGINRVVVHFKIRLNLNEISQKPGVNLA
jgi:hypothetical protein